jgi:hypothetical protein
MVFHDAYNETTRTVWRNRGGKEEMKPLPFSSLEKR